MILKYFIWVYIALNLGNLQAQAAGGAGAASKHLSIEAGELEAQLPAENLDAASGSYVGNIRLKGRLYKLSMNLRPLGVITSLEKDTIKRTPADPSLVYPTLRAILPLLFVDSLVLKHVHMTRDVFFQNFFLKFVHGRWEVVDRSALKVGDTITSLGVEFIPVE